MKVLALTLLREVEYLEEQGANNASCALDLQSEVHRFEAEMIRSALIRTGGRQRRAARLLGMKTTTLNSKIRRYQIDVNETCSVSGTLDNTQQSEFGNASIQQHE